MAVQSAEPIHRKAAGVDQTVVPIDRQEVVAFQAADLQHRRLAEAFQLVGHQHRRVAEALRLVNEGYRPAEPTDWPARKKRRLAAPARRQTRETTAARPGVLLARPESHTRQVAHDDSREYRPI